MSNLLRFYNDPIQDYLKQYGTQVEIVVMDMNPSFKAAVNKALNRPVIVAERFHYCRSIYWVVDEARRKVQRVWHAYDFKKMKRMRSVLHKDSSKLNHDDRWYLERYSTMSAESKEAYELKELYKEWKRNSKEAKNIIEIKRGLEAFYREVEIKNNPAFLKAIKTFKNWPVEILNSYVFNYSNGFLECIQNTSKVMKRNVYGFRKYEHFKAKLLLSRFYKGVGVHVG